MRVELSEEAIADLTAIYDFVATQASDTIATRLIDEIEQRCMRLADAPHGGRALPGSNSTLRIISWKRRMTLFYSVESERIEVRRVFYGGQNYKGILGS